MKKWLCAALLALTLEQASADDRKYPASAISESIAKNTDAVTRLNKLRVDFIAPDNVKIHRNFAVTVLNEKGLNLSVFAAPYDKYVKIEDFKGYIYDASGLRIKEIETIEDRSAISDFSLYEDSRLKIAAPDYANFPFTVEYMVSEQWSSSLYLPSWSPESGDMPVESAVLEVSVSKGQKLRYLLENGMPPPTTTKSSDNDLYRWELKAIPKLTLEPNSEPFEEVAKFVRLAPEKFTVDNVNGDMSTWENFGRWNYALWANQQNLPMEIQSEIAPLIKSGEDAENAKRLYAYLQQKTRYVSIQLGIGGWKPYDARYVHQNGYGDCKALTNFMLALCKAAGLQAYPALIRNGAGAKGVNPSFPKQAFNHVILFLPLKSDTVWLECTSQCAPFGFIGASNEDRYALLITPSGGKLVRTPKSNSKNNLQLRKAFVTIEPRSKSRIDAEMQWTGNQLPLHLINAKNDIREGWAKAVLEIPSYNLLNADFTNLRAGKETATIQVSAESANIGAASGKRLFIQPNLFIKPTPAPENTRRRTPLKFVYPFLDIDTVEYRLPEGFAVETQPQPVKIATTFATFEMNCKVDGNALRYVRRYEIIASEIPPERYSEYIEFRNKIAAADKAQIVLIRR